MTQQEHVPAPPSWQWRLNNYLLEIPEVQGNINSEVQEFFELNKNSAPTQIIWDTFKTYIKGVLTAIKAVKNKAKNISRLLLLQKIADLEALHKQMSTRDTAEEISWLYHQVTMIDVLEIAQSLMYAKQTAFEYRDRAGKQLARLLSEHPVRKTEVPMRTASGGLTSNGGDKLKISVEYYKGLYKAECIDRQKMALFLESIRIKELTLAHMEKLEAPISISEIYKAISHLRPNSSPGLDGLTPEFYMRFAQVLMPLYMSCLITVYLRRQFPLCGGEQRLY